jgi:hypothetical protein
MLTRTRPNITFIRTLPAFFFLQIVTPQTIFKVNPSNISVLIVEENLIDIRISEMCLSTFYTNTNTHTLKVLSVFNNHVQSIIIDITDMAKVRYCLYLSPQNVDSLSIALHCYLIYLFSLQNQLEPQISYFLNLKTRHCESLLELFKMRKGRPITN